MEDEQQIDNNLHDPTQTSPIYTQTFLLSYLTQIRPAKDPRHQP
jgi:hypothetical protein